MSNLVDCAQTVAQNTQTTLSMKQWSGTVAVASIAAAAAIVICYWKHEDSTNKAA